MLRGAPRRNMSCVRMYVGSLRRRVCVGRLLQEDETMQLGCGVLLQLHRRSEHCLLQKRAVDGRVRRRLLLLW